MSVVDSFLGNARSYGLYDLLLPWLFAFALIYGVFEFIPPFNKEKRLRAILSLVMATYLINYTPAGTTVGQFFTTLFGQGIFVLSGILVGLMLVGLVFGESGWKDALKKPLELVLNILGVKNKEGQEIIIVGALFLVGILIMLFAANSFGMSISMPSMSIDNDTLWAIILIGVAVAAVVFIAK